VQDDNSVVSLFAKELDRYNRRVGKAMDAATQTEPALRYSAQVVRVYNSLSLTGLPERDPRLNQLPLDDIFVTLSVDIDVSEPSSPANGFEPSKPDDPLAPRGQRSAEMRLRQRAPPVPQRLSVGEALSRYRRLVIVGAPGGGKTTLLRWLAVTFASERQAEPNRLGPNFAAPYIPVVLELRRFADRFASLTEQPATFDLAAEASAFIAQDARFAGTPSELIHDAIVAGRCLILLDGLDEIADQATRRRLIEAIEALCLDPQRGSTGNLCLLTTRPHGFVNLALGAGFQTVTVRPFEAEDVATFTRTWYRIAYGDDALADEAQDLIAAIQANDRVAGLASNPLLCTIIAIVYRNNRVLPERRVELYLKCCEALLDTWERNKDIKSSGLIGGFGWQIKLELLAALAYWMHGETERLAAADDLVVEQIARALEADEIARPGSAEDEARHFIETIRDRSGLLRGRGDGTLEFSHRTFQEYLAARHVATLEDEAMLDAVMPHLHAAWWEEVHLLLFGHLGSGKENSGRVERLALCILDATPHPQYWRPVAGSPAGNETPESVNCWEGTSRLRFAVIVSAP
jgi:predicted NACHT family NTPase